MSPNLTGFYFLALMPSNSLAEISKNLIPNLAKNYAFG
ncbi:hypothetical protein CAMRE0001_0078 [Campylobacter rectus RM3267]|uniref:Uncharacterized protein n=1 Tax=Campylobacter rectus RM3267 TaxID=553218 RepID=B9CXS3_CAMRE|nr:hypothetical protein CAMRE0001_0078 [Campylobacter rectus RM3267]